MTKYRIRLPNGRVIGPFDKKQLFELKGNGHITGKEEAQVYPSGNWGPLSNLDIYDELMDENRTIIRGENEDKTFVVDLESLRRKKTEMEIEELSEAPAPAPESHVTETIRMTPSELDIPAPTKTQVRGDSLDIELDSHDSSEDVGEKTQINPQAQAELRALREKERKEEEEKLRAEEEKRRKEEERLQRALEEEKKQLPEVSSNDSTQMFSLDRLKTDLLEKATDEEEEFEKGLALHNAELALEYDGDDEEDEDEPLSEEDQKKAKKKKIFIIGAALLLAYALLFPGDDEKKPPPFKHIPTEVVFPIPFDVADPAASKVLFTKGAKIFGQGTYPALVQSGKEFKTSYENDVENLDALNMMVRSYGEELQFSKKKLTDAVTLFNIVQSKRPFLMKNPNGVIGINRFYLSIDKAEAAVDVISKYLKLQPKNLTQELFAAYLDSLIKAGRIVTAREFFTALEKAPNKNQYSYAALINYHRLNQENEKAMEYVTEANKKFPLLVQFYLLKAEMLIQEKKYPEAAALLQDAQKLQLEYNDHYRAKFLELTGVIAAVKGQVKVATQMFQGSLAIEESSSLRMKLGELKSAEGMKDASSLIAQSQAYKLLVEAQDFYNKKSFELALVSAAKATDASPGHIPAEIFLSKVQLRLGLAKQALKTLEDLIQLYPNDLSVNVALIQTYIDTYKFNEARRRLAIISGTDMKETWEYASLNAQLGIKMNDFLRAITWLKTSINLNPLNDHDIYLLAELLLKKSNFEQARVLLNKAIELDPVNPDYRILYARMIYETQDDQAAIGYLLEQLEEFGESPKLMAEIAIFFFRSGRVKDFQDYKAKLAKLPTKDKSLYEFLIKAALLDERYTDVPELVEELLKIEPGDLENMMVAGKVLFESGKLVEAAHWFKRVKDKLPSYPQVQYYTARIKFLSGDIEGAFTEVNEDLKDNGETDDSLVFLGRIYEEKGDLIAAENTYKKAQKINPRSYDALVGLADLSTKRNNFDLALDLYKRAQTQRSDEPIIHKKIGDVYRLLGQGALAIEAYKLYLDMNPEARDKNQIESYIRLMQ